MEALFASGKSFNAFPIKVFYTIAPVNQSDLAAKSTDRDFVKAGVGVSARNFKKAVDRNRVKRLLREVYRTQKQDLINAAALQFSSLNVFFLYVGKELPEYVDLKISMEKTLEKLIVRMSETAKQ